MPCHAIYSKAPLAQPWSCILLAKGKGMGEKKKRMRITWMCWCWFVSTFFVVLQVLVPFVFTWHWWRAFPLIGEYASVYLGARKKHGCLYAGFPHRETKDSTARVVAESVVHRPLGAAAWLSRRYTDKPVVVYRISVNHVRKGITSPAILFTAFSSWPLEEWRINKKEAMVSTVSPLYSPKIGPESVVCRY